LWAHPDIEAAKAAISQGEFRVALTRLKRADESPSKTEDEVADMLWYRGFCLQVLGKGGEANQSFDALLDLRPLYRPDEYETPPDIQEAFKRRFDAHRKLHGVDLGTPNVAAGWLVVPVVRHAEKVTTVAAFVRVQGAAVYKTLTARVVGQEARVPLADAELREQMAQATVLEVVLEARNRTGVQYARLADAAHPLAVQIPPGGGAPPLEATPPQPVADPGAKPGPGVTVAKNGVTTPTQVPVTAEAGGEKNKTMLYAGAGVGVLAAGAGALTLLAVVAAVASLGMLGGTWYALGNVKGIMKNPAYSALLALYQVSPFALGGAAVLAGLFLVVTAGAGAGAGALVALGMRE
jgi:hypothetical protein